MRFFSFNLANMLKIIVLINLLLLVLSCSTGTCTKEGDKAVRAARRGDVRGVKEYIDNGGDPLYSCSYSRSGALIDMTGRKLDQAVAFSGSYDLISYYLDQDIPQEVKDAILIAVATDDDLKIVKMVLRKGGKASAKEWVCYSGSGAIDGLNNLEKCGYDFNWKDPETGNTLFMDYATCPAPDKGDAEEVIEVMQFLVKAGAKTRLKNKKGKTALQQASHSKVRAYLKTL